MSNGHPVLIEPAPKNPSRVDGLIGERKIEIYNIPKNQKREENNSVEWLEALFSFSLSFSHGFIPEVGTLNHQRLVWSAPQSSRRYKDKLCLRHRHFMLPHHLHTHNSRWWFSSILFSLFYQLENCWFWRCSCAASVPPHWLYSWVFCIFVVLSSSRRLAPLILLSIILQVFLTHLGSINNNTNILTGLWNMSLWILKHFASFYIHILLGHLCSLYG